MSSRHNEYPTQTLLRGNLSQELREPDDLAMPGGVCVIMDAVHQTEGNAASYLCMCMCSAPSALTMHHIQRSRIRNEDFSTETEVVGMKGHSNPLRLLQNIVTACSSLPAILHDVVRDETLSAQITPMHLARELVLPKKGTRRSSPEDYALFDEKRKCMILSAGACNFKTYRELLRSRRRSLTCGLVTKVPTGTT